MFTLNIFYVSRHPFNTIRENFLFYVIDAVKVIIIIKIIYNEDINLLPFNLMMISEWLLSIGLGYGSGLEKEWVVERVETWWRRRI